MNRVAAFALRRKNSILSMSEKMFCPPQPLRFWITPACAGKRMKSGSSWMNWWDHPRVCGEKCGYRLPFRSIVGSPPRVRGKVQPERDVQDAARITPAYAGKRCSARTPTFRTWDHPRVCGEKLWTWQRLKNPLGSPPRVRGKVIVDLVLTKGHRITPACAGKSLTREILLIVSRDHPRVCGEKVWMLSAVA